MSQHTALDDIGRAITWLRGHGETNGKVGAVGFCMGGSLVFLGAARDPLPDATIAYYGFPVVKPTALAPLQVLDEAGRIRTPLLGFWGDQDRGVGMDNVDAYDNALKQAEIPHEFIVYPGLGHGFLTFDPSSAAYEGSQDSFRRVLGFYREHLAG
jgi:carboxymethylenebutenolidase